MKTWLRFFVMVLVASVLILVICLGFLNPWADAAPEKSAVLTTGQVAAIQAVEQLLLYSEQHNSVYLPILNR